MDFSSFFLGIFTVNFLIFLDFVEFNLNNIFLQSNLLHFIFYCISGRIDAQTLNYGIRSKSLLRKYQVINNNHYSLKNKPKINFLNFRFIGELFKTGFMPLKMVQEYLLSLTSSSPSGVIGDEERDVECLCRLLAIVGRAEGSRGISTDRSLVWKLDRVVEEDRASNRIRFMIQDLLEMRQNDWVSRRQLRNPFHFTAPSSNF